MAEALPIATAPKDGSFILISDGCCWPPDVVQWRPARPKRVVNGTIYHGVPAGWFFLHGGRSRFDPLTPGHLMEARVWWPLPEVAKPPKCDSLDQIIADRAKVRSVQINP